MKPTNWAPLVGSFEFTGDLVVFKGGTVKYGEEPGAALGTAISNLWFGGGTVSAGITFTEVSPRSACSLILFRNPTTGDFLSAGLATETLYGIRHFDTRWTVHSAVGDGTNLQPNRAYHIECDVRGSLITLRVDRVEVSTVTLPFPIPRSQVGVWCRDYKNISISDFTVVTEAPRAFVVMQFSSPYNELYQEVVKPLCNEFGVEAKRADETYGPGLIIADVIRHIDEAKLVIAEISPANPNVYYEVGYAHARRKPTILIADRAVSKLPFDVSPFRTLFYENTIDGKGKIEDGLRRHLSAILNPSGGAV